MDLGPVLAFVLMLAVSAGISLPLGRETAVVRLVVAQVVLAAALTAAFIGLESYFA